ncbi:MAG: T9SS type A sorting domain-containing protein [bacterium]
MKRIATLLTTMFVPLFSLLSNGAIGKTNDAKASAQGETISVGPGRLYTVPSAAALIAKDSDVIEIDAGNYGGDVAIWRANNLVLRGIGGFAHLLANGNNAEGKAIWVVKGNNTTIENIEFSGATVPDQNGAGIRQEGTGLIVRRCYFHDNETGILTGANAASDILIEQSEFANNGYGDGQSHNMYIGRVRSFTLRFSYSHHAKIGHNVKSRAQLNYILYNRIMDEQSGTSSYLIDLPNGGTSYIIGNLLQQGPNTDNSTLVSYGAEGLINTMSDLYVANNTFVNDDQSGRFVFVRSDATPAKIINNLFVGPGAVLGGPGEQITNLATNNAGLVDISNFDYRLSSSSPAINAGSDPGFGNGFALTPNFQYVHEANGEGRAQVGAIDVGAYEFGSTTSLDSRPGQGPKQFGLEQNYPNPFNPSTTISFSIPEQSHVILKVFDMHGREVEELVNGVLDSGKHAISFEIGKARRTALPSGMYFYRLQTSSHFQQQKMLILK